MKFQDLPEAVQAIAAETLKALMIEERFNKNEKSAETMAQDVKSGFESLYSENATKTVIGHLVVNIEPQIVGLEKLETLITQLQSRAGEVTGLRLS
ncbi:hypothetical protein HmCmsJML134_00140 [Escherichia coli]|uniref:hypothetical protein n=1 Tax=Escherichia coli TaxID=562 RepID=UPI0010CCA2D0|nr:hypothetical protein [Escherichia coli]EHS7020119.1 hypothetical protein [Escherichia coli]GDB17673.1 hypothetical protein HmCmsJML134_00140 [Escherichia coli]